MNIEFHYYIIYILCRNAGFSEEESYIVAYSSQYIDNNFVSYKINLGSQIYETIPTQNYGWWNEYYPKNVYVPFHFFPGDTDYQGARRRDHKKNPLSCTPNSSRVKELLIRSLKTRNLYRVGIGLHTYADSWAHQNFSGFSEAWNEVDQGSMIPSMGHAQVLGTPDIIAGFWTDPRLEPGLDKISNEQRFLEAARKIYKYLCTYNRQDFDDHDFVIDRITRLLTGYGRSTTREERIANYIIEADIIQYNKFEWINSAVYNIDTSSEAADGFAAYDKLLWLKDALLYKSELSKKPLLTPKENFSDSHWYRWNEAAREHLKDAKDILKDLTNKGG